MAAALNEWQNRLPGTFSLLKVTLPRWIPATVGAKLTSRHPGLSVKVWLGTSRPFGSDMQISTIPSPASATSTANRTRKTAFHSNHMFQIFLFTNFNNFSRNSLNEKLWILKNRLILQNKITLPIWHKRWRKSGLQPCF